jgi:xylan 1,4-beta-xylosidase
LKIKGERSTFTFSYSQGNVDYMDIESVESKYLSSETLGWFTGVYEDYMPPGKTNRLEEPATYDWFVYEPLPVPAGGASGLF